MLDNLRHRHQKDRKQNSETTNNSNRLKERVDKICLIFSVVMPLTTIPQIHLIYTEKHATGVSLLMWVFYCIGVIPFLLYGILHKERQLIILNSLWLVAQIIIIIGIVMYG